MSASTIKQECKNNALDCLKVQNVAKAVKVHQSCNDEQLVEFCVEEYESLLNDYHHIITAHDHQLEEINDILKTIKCNVKECKCMQHRRKTQLISNQLKTENNKKKLKNEQLIYFQGLMNQIHVHLVHSFAVRIRPSLIKNSIDEIKSNDDTDDILTFDEEFSKISELIKQQRQSTAFDRIDNKNKFNITGSGSVTSANNNTNVLQEDETDVKCDATKNKQNSQKLGIFRSGYRFYYWPYYRNNDSTGQNITSINESDQIFKYRELYVATKYINLKEEITKNQTCPLPMEDFKRSMVKGMEFLKSDIGKTLKSMVKDKFYYYCISKFDPIGVNHIICMMFYTDYSNLSANFTATFREIEENESLESIKNRNREFANWARLMRECVELFGNKISKQDNLYCGMSPLLLRSFLIKLHGPTSTTSKWETAAHFANINDDETHGIVITLNRANVWTGEALRYFHSKLVSQFVEEEEYTLIGGKHYISIMSIRLSIDRRWFNLAIFCKSLYYFENMLTGTAPMNAYTKPATNKHNRIIKKLIEGTLTSNDKDVGYLEYVNCLFPYFCGKKTQIIINLDAVNTFFNKIKNNIFLERNILNLEKVTNVFPNVKIIQIVDYNKHSKTRNHSNEFDLFTFLSLANNVLHSKNNKLIQIKLSVYRKRSAGLYQQSWLLPQYVEKIENNKDLKLRNICISDESKVNISRLFITCM